MCFILLQTNLLGFISKYGKQLRACLESIFAFLFLERTDNKQKAELPDVTFHEVIKSAARVISSLLVDKIILSYSQTKPSRGCVDFIAHVTLM